MTRITDRDLVPVKPALFSDFACPKCKAGSVSAQGVLFPGAHVLGDYTCTSCGTAFVRDLPVGFAVDHAVSIAKNDGSLLDRNGAENWLMDPLLKAFSNRSDAPVKIERKVNRACNRIILLDTIDFLYGHVLLKLYSAQHYIDNYPDHGVVVILPRMFAWLEPKGCAEVWIVDVKLGQGQVWHNAINAFVRERLAEYAEVNMGRGWAHPDFTRIDIERYTGIAPFKLEEFSTRPPHITFVARQDRLWFPNMVDKFLFRTLGAVGLLGFARKVWSGAQDRLIRSSMRAIKKEFPACTFNVVGLAPSGGYGSLAEDLRTTSMSKDVELAWCRAYAKSQLVVGVHGSNMLLPTAFAAGCIEILPSDRQGNIVQDISVRWADRMQLFLYRFVGEFASPGEVADHAIGMLRYFDLYRLHNVTNTFTQGPRT
ncbi:MAG: hypothetical protein IPJ76_04750 [Flavobacteriales bacterium]|nr:MAG: hypothetical protein IPJ76_04750 [Flavobacteriales bacterium]